MKTLFEISRPGSGCGIFGARRFAEHDFGALTRESALDLPEVSEVELSRHYTRLAKRAFGVNCGFYPLGSCTMKYNPRVDEETASLPGFAMIHPTQEAPGCEKALELAKSSLCEITGMDDMTFMPAAGAHGEFTGLLLIKAYHASRGDTARRKMIVPDSAHGTNPASAAMAGFEVVNIPSNREGGVDVEALRSAAGADTAGLMLTNPNTLGLFDPNILEISEIVHNAGGLMYYDGANLNAVMGVARPGDMGFDVVHLNLHKTFATPHGGGGPGSGPVGCKKPLAQFLPGSALCDEKTGFGQIKAFHGNFLVVVKALTYILTLGGSGLREASVRAVANANYLLSRVRGTFEPAYDAICMHEFVLSLENFKKETGVSALDVAKGLIDKGMHPPTMYFPLIVHEALMFEPTETETRETLDEAARALAEVAALARTDPEALHTAPHGAPISRPDEVLAARKPIVKFE